MRDLSELIEEAHAMALASMQEHRRHAVDAGELLREALNRLPPLTGSTWVTEHTLLTLSQATAYLNFEQWATLGAEMARRVSALTHQELEAYRQAGEARGVTDQVELEGAGGSWVGAQLELCHAVLDQSEVTASELAAVEAVLGQIAKLLTAQLAGHDRDSRLFVAQEA